MNILSLAAAGVLAAALWTPAAVAAPLAQATFYDLEPNDTKAEAVLAVGLVPGDQIVLGNHFGFYDPDVFQVQPAALPAGIYRHTLRDDVAVEPTRFRALGLDGVLDEVLPDSLSILSDSSDGDPAAPMVAWYGFGKSEELYVELYTSGYVRNGDAASIVFESEQVVPEDIGTLDPYAGTFFLQANGTGMEADTELFVFDAEYNLVPSGWADDQAGFNSAATARPTLTPGRYYVAVSTKGLSSHRPPSHEAPSGTEFALPSGVTDFKGPLVAANFAGSTTVLLTVGTGFGSGALNAPLTIPSSQSAAWATFTVGPNQETFSFCPGDGTAGPCPCGNESPVGARVGCLHSEGRGASMISNRTLLGRVRLGLESLPRNAGAAVFVSMGTQAPAASLGGLSCLAAPAVRLPVVFADGIGSAEVIEELVGTSGYLSGMTVFSQAAYRDPNAAAGCQVNFTSGVAFRL